MSWLKWFEPQYVAPWTKTNSLTHGYVTRFICWEPIFFFGGEWFKGNEKIYPRTRMHDVFDYPIGERDFGHPCPKPSSLWVAFLEDYTVDSAIVLDPFLGSGTTLVACERLNRIGRGVEISPAYCAVAIQRLVDMGLEAELI